MNPQVGHEIPGEKEGAQMMQLTQVQLAQIVSSAVSQALTQYVQQTASSPSQDVSMEALKKKKRMETSGGTGHTLHSCYVIEGIPESRHYWL